MFSPPSWRRAARARVDGVLGCDAELAQDDVAGRRCAESIDTHDVVGVAFPTERTPPLRPRASACRRGSTSNRYVVGLLFEELPRRHRHHPRRDSDRREHLARGDAHRHLGAGADEHDVGLVLVLAREDVRPRRQRRPARARRVPSSTGIFWRVQDQRVGPSPSRWTRHAAATSLASAGRIDPQPGHRAQRRELLDRLVRRAVLADTDRVVRPYEADLRLHDRREAHGRPHVVAEDEERTDARGRGRSRAIPLADAPMPCSRMPKWMSRPVASSGLKTPRLLTFMPVLPVRSPEPVNRPGTRSTTALSTSSIAARVARSLPGCHVGSFCSQPCRPAPVRHASNSSGGEVGDVVVLRAPPTPRVRLRPACPPRGTRGPRRRVRRSRSAGRPRIFLVAATSSAPSGLPCAAASRCTRATGSRCASAARAASAGLPRPCLRAMRLRARRRRSRPRPAPARASPYASNRSGDVVAVGELGRTVDRDVVVVVDERRDGRA